jgi:hypothetical protein
MRRVAWALLPILLFSICALGETRSLRLDQQGYLQELDRWTAIVQSVRDGKPDAMPSDVPDEWIVTENGTEYHVPTIFLARDLTKPDQADGVLERLQLLRASAIEAASEEDTARNARSTADRILARREFRRVRIPGAEESLRDRFNAWLKRVLIKFFGKAFEHVDDLRVLSDIVVWAVLLLAVAVLLYWLRKAFLQATDSEMHIRGARPEYVSFKPMEQWLSEARDAASRGEYRVAVRLAYWGAISGLERAGVWKPDRARTPREYLKLARGSQYEPSLHPLTRDFERVWYAKQPATEADFLACMARVEEMHASGS